MRHDHDFTLWLYGSHSRGNNDAVSDVDILLISDDENDDSPLRELPQFPQEPTISRYKWSEIEQMAEYGSLFLRHLSLEGRAIAESPRAVGRLSALLSSLGPYQRASRDLEGFWIVHADVRESLINGGASTAFEAATLATVFRHASILGCNLFDVPCFSRLEPVERILHAWSLPSTWSAEFSELYRYRLVEDGRVNVPQDPSTEYVWEWHTRVTALLTKLGRRIHG